MHAKGGGCCKHACTWGGGGGGAGARAPCVMWLGSRGSAHAAHTCRPTTLAGVLLAPPTLLAGIDFYVRDFALRAPKEITITAARLRR